MAMDDPATAQYKRHPLQILLECHHLLHIDPPQLYGGKNCCVLSDIIAIPAVDVRTIYENLMSFCCIHHNPENIVCFSTTMMHLGSYERDPENRKTRKLVDS